MASLKLPKGLWFGWNVSQQVEIASGTPLGGEAQSPLFLGKGCPCPGKLAKMVEFSRLVKEPNLFLHYGFKGTRLG